MPTPAQQAWTQAPLAALLLPDGGSAGTPLQTAFTLPSVQRPTASQCSRAVSADLKSEIQASEARQEKQMDELKKANEVPAGKVDQLLDAFRAAKA